MILRLYLTLICALAVISATKAQIVPDDTVAGRLTVSLLTCAPGDMVYELEGHTGLRLCRDGQDVTVHWGVFDFNAPNFIYRFVKGETDYSVGVVPTRYFIEEYRRSGRKVTEQVLDLTDSQAAEIVRLIQENLRPENRVYRYNYVLDNCATRPLSIIEAAIGDTLSMPDTDIGLSKRPTFRSIMNRYHANYPWYQFGIDIALGSGIDYPVTVRQTAFAPVILQRLMDGATVTGGNGQRHIVSRTETLVEGDDSGMVSGPTPWWLSPMTAGILVLLLSIGVTLRDISRRKVSRWFDVVVYTVYGLMGCVVAFLVFVSVHEATSPNIQLLWLNPLCLIVPVAVWSRYGRRVVFGYQCVNMVSVMLFLILWSCGVQSMTSAVLPFVMADAVRSLNYIFIGRGK